MAGFSIALALLAVAVVAVPIRSWWARVVGTFRRRARADRCVGPAPAYLPAGLRRLARLGREASAVIEHLVPIAAEYRRTLPFVSLVFADVRGGAHHVRRDRWIVAAREDFEGGVGDVAAVLYAWRAQIGRLRGREAAQLCEADAGIIAALLDDGSRLPRTWGEARRFRFCEHEEVDHLLQDLHGVAAALRRIEAALTDRTRKSPYR